MEDGEEKVRRGPTGHLVRAKFDSQETATGITPPLLRIKGIKGSIIGAEETLLGKGISGGEMKRLSISGGEK